GGTHRARSGTAGRGELLRWRDGKDDQPAEPGDRGRCGRPGRAGRGHLPQGLRVEPAAAVVHVPDRHAAGDPGAELDGAVAETSQVAVSTQTPSGRWRAAYSSAMAARTGAWSPTSSRSRRMRRMARTYPNTSATPEPSPAGS